MTAMVLSMLLACSYERYQKRLDNDEFNHWYALRVYMTEDQKKDFLKRKTRAERDQFLKENGCEEGLNIEECSFWDRFYKYTEEERAAIISGEVKTKWSRDMLYMAWGAPYDRMRALGRDATRSEKLIYRFEQQEDGQILLWEPNSKTAYKAVRLFIKEVIIDDDVVAEITDKNDSW